MIYHTDELLAFMQKIIDASPHNDAITLVGKVPHSDLQYWFNSADIIIAGSYYEGSGTAVCEAMSCACMPIVTDIFSFRMITDNGRCGLLFEPGNEAELLSALKKCSEVDIIEKQETALEYFESDLSFEAIADKIEDVAQAL
jgi:glycosyltransferase involved in cell wall biosynthesis